MRTSLSGGAVIGIAVAISVIFFALIAVLAPKAAPVGATPDPADPTAVYTGQGIALRIDEDLSGGHEVQSSACGEKGFRLVSAAPGTDRAIDGAVEVAYLNGSAVIEVKGSDPCLPAGRYTRQE